MSCCKDKLLLFIELREDQRTDKSVLDAAKVVLMESVDFTEDQATLAVDYAKRTGKCLILEGNSKEVSAVTSKLAENMIGAVIENKSLK
jgi:hypothetical protein